MEEVVGEVIVEKAGLFDTIQDMGRIGFQEYGMPQAGAVDQYAYQLGNILVGNSRHTPSLELTWFGPTLTFTQDTSIALTGATFSARLNGALIQPWSLLAVRRGDRLEMGSATSGCRAYLAVQGGFMISPKMGSASTYVTGQLGGWQGRPLQTDDRIPYSLRLDERNTNGTDKKQTKTSSRQRFISPSYRPSYPKHNVLRVILGPQEQHFTKQGRDTFLHEGFTVTPQMDRMGLRLSGQAIEHDERFGADILSDSIPFGGIQVPANGQPIIMLADRQTTGGYPKIATIISADWSKLAQLRPKDSVQFQEVTVEEAQALYREQEKELTSFEFLAKSMPR
ncbi:biotin-dependent carboxyltransferase family protein [Bacillus horti]|uniref:Antagonist of KipI n=1 Tax=Caldalkalibacillus horti TaxID=77523 RepID=A0ABT9VZP9_9BACI|nr:biotin-dependent carboxyltransferase family protein [Bacillus horti]MDQ0166454.1 antagonist of KipI [Bacillus horti]